MKKRHLAINPQFEDLEKKIENCLRKIERETGINIGDISMSKEIDKEGSSKIEVTISMAAGSLV